MGRTIHIYGFPSYVTAELVKNFLENHTGKETVYALQIGKHKNKKGSNRRVFADVQFISNQKAELMSSLINRPKLLYYGNSYLKVQNKERDIIPKPRVSMFHLKVPALHFGCQVSDESFFNVWKARDVSVDFGFGLRKLYFLLSYSGVEYKLELSYESIWDIQLRSPENPNTPFLLIQMLAAPRIYEKPLSSSGKVFRDPTLQYFMDTLDDQWVRTTDFTPSSCIGQSSAMCLELPSGCKLPDFQANFPYYNSLVQNGCLAWPTLDLNFFRVQITPSKVYFTGPEINVSNRVLRHYREDIDNFIRISFVDEDSEKILSSDLSTRTTGNEDKKHTRLYNRILSTLRNGIVIGDKKFDFLAFSSSQLLDNSAWMFASRCSLTAACIRVWMGDFGEIRNVAKYAARLGQSFGSSTETLNVYSHEIEIIPDVEIVSNRKKYLFSDGIGKISSQFALLVAIKCGCQSSTPSAFQIRYGGYKGVVAVDPTSEMKLSLRKSMSKFTSQNTKLDVLSWSKFQPCFLNRQVITLLSTLGVQDHVFEKKQREVVHQLDLILTDPLRAYETLEIMSQGENTNILKEMLSCGYKPDQEPFLSMMLQTFRAAKLLELRTRTRIFIQKGRSMMGCLDETRTLKYGQVFIQISCPGGKRFHGDSLSMLRGNVSDNNTFVVVGKVIVAKNPCLHPGDMRVLRAVNVRALHHMVDCVVFPQKGKRPHPNECSGSDLDGDGYFVSWDQELIPHRQVQPMDYDAAPSMLLDHDVTIEV
ncbi:RNA-dependent RNA polymerase [Macleaya cordata]|uniref:RNA-dependent RNA polymerase n=1 Tax=Macleaya cordata TaxID=56857 RepID=A0A200Q146_MACCD|nr:RNA-dependent RNA polymerase [Macleaya cordata]